MKIVAVSGFFNPPHPGHLTYFQKARELGDVLVAIVNNDLQVKIKGSPPLLNENERLAIVRSLREVDFALLAHDKDISVAETLKYLRPHIFAKGGDRNISNLPQNELDVCKECDIEIICGICPVGGSSTEIKNRRK
jgi:cytidyltransferase-like protein